jgi:hypothetical protein
MLLGEALAERASKNKQLAQVEARAVSVARYQEGERPAESAGDLLETGRRLVGELRQLARRINRTNSVTELDPGFTLTDALALRDGYAADYRLVSAVADAAAGARGQTWGRQLRSELQQVSAVPVPDLRAEADRIAEARRNLDVRIQQAGWSIELLD